MRQKARLSTRQAQVTFEDFRLYRFKMDEVRDDDLAAAVVQRRLFEV